MGKIGITDSAYYEGVAEKIREKLGVREQYAPSQLAEKVDAVYNKGKQAEYDAFWDTFQLNGTRTKYAYAFSNGNFSVDTFYPKYDIILETDNPMVFNAWLGQRVYNDEPIFNFKQRLEECGVRLDTSKATQLTRLFDYCYYFTEIPTIDLSSISTNNVNVNRIFASCLRLVTIEKLIVKDTIAPTNAFIDCQKLKHIVIEGTIGQNGFNFQWSTKLSKASITSIMNALSTTTSGLTLTLSSTAVNSAFGSTDNSEWVALKNSRTNWTISLA